MEYTLLNMNSGEWPSAHIRILENSFRYFNLAEGRKQDFTVEKEGLIFFFLLEGACEITIEKKSSISIKENFFILLPVGKKSGLYARRNCSLILLYIPSYSFISMYTIQDHILPLQLSPALRQFLLFTLLVLQDGKMDHVWMALKIKEFFFLLKNSYSREELEPFARILSSENRPFHRLMWQAMEEAESVSDLLRISGMKRTTFEKKFKKEFGLSPYQLLLQYKAMRVKDALGDSLVSLKDVSRNCGFNSASHFVRFCRQQFGETPRQIRRRLLSTTLYKHTYL